MIPQNPELVTAKSLSVEVAKRDPQTAQLDAMSSNQDLRRLSWNAERND